MNRLQIGYIAGHSDHPSSQINRRLGQVHAVIDALVRPHRLVRTDITGITNRPAILDLSIRDEEIKEAMLSLADPRYMGAYWLVLSMTDAGIPDIHPEVPVYLYRNAAHVTPIIQRYLDSLGSSQG